MSHKMENDPIYGNQYDYRPKEKPGSFPLILCITYCKTYAFVYELIRKDIEYYP